MGERASRWMRRGVLAALWLAAGWFFLFGGEYSLSELRSLEAERDSLAARVDSLAAVAESLERRAEELRTSDFAVERLARERYGFIRDGERLYRFVETAPGNGQEAGGTRVDRSGTRE